MRHKRTTELRYPGLWRGCVGAWAPCLGPTGLTLRDWSGCRRDGTLTNMAATRYVPVREKYALQFASGTESVVIGNESKLLQRPSFTISLWVISSGSQPSTFGGYLVSDFDGANTATIGVRIQNSANIQAFTDGNGTDAITASSVVTTGVPLHVCYVVRSSTNKELFINGVSRGTSTTSVTRGTSTSPIHLGRGGDFYSTLSLLGYLDDVMFFNRSLQPAEISLLSRRRGIAYETRRRHSVSVGIAPSQAGWISKTASRLSVSSEQQRVAICSPQQRVWIARSDNE